jgi:hypothetical protein
VELGLGFAGVRKARLFALERFSKQAEYTEEAWSLGYWTDSPAGYSNAGIYGDCIQQFFVFLRHRRKPRKN